MRFLCLAYYDEKKFAALPPEDVDAIVSRCPPHDRALRDSGRLLATASLGPTSTAKSVRPRDGKPSFTDGPFAETKEQIGAFFIVEADSLDEAARIAAMHPAAHLGEEIGWGIEVRAIDRWSEPQDARGTKAR